MDNRLYFVVGDLLANIAIGAIIGMISAALVNTGWNMWIAMIVAMVVGMALSLPLALAFGYFYGAMEVMVPAMQTGMWSGMVVGMWAAMSPLDISSGALIGGVVGLVVLNVIWALNIALRGIRPLGGQS